MAIMNINSDRYNSPWQGSAGQEYYKGNTGKSRKSSAAPEGAKGTEESKASENAADKTCREQILEKMAEMAKKVKDGTVEPTFQIGAMSYTMKEWDKLLEKFDAAEEALQAEVQAQIEEAEKQAAKEALQREMDGKTGTEGTETTVAVTESTAEAVTEEGATEEIDAEQTAALLTNEVTKCSYPTDDPKKKHWFITAYGPDGISCKEAYFDGTGWVNKDCWKFSYTEEGQYEKVMAFLKRFPADANLRFAAHENFWKDFLAGEIDEDDFVHFFETSTKDGVPDYTYEKDGSTYIDREKVKYAKYMNDFDAHFYTAEEMDLLQRAIIHENGKGLHKISDYEGQMTIPGEGKNKGGKDDGDDLDTQIVTKPDGSTVLQIKSNLGMMEVEITQAQRFGLQYKAQSGAAFAASSVYRMNADALG